MDGMEEPGDILSLTRAFARERHAGSAPAHDFSHVERVYALAERIAEEEGAELLTVRLAALLHDVGRGLEKREGPAPDRHEELSAVIAEPFLLARGLTPGRVAAVLDCVLRHRHRRGEAPESIEARCLYDADKLDSLGAVGVARAYLWLGEHGRSLRYPPESWAGVDPSSNATEVDSIQREWEIKLKGLPARMHTATGKRLAALRAERMERFLAWLEEEHAGLS